MKQNCPEKEGDAADTGQEESLCKVTSGIPTAAIEKKTNQKGCVAETNKLWGDSANAPRRAGVYRPESWVFDCAANRHLVGDKRYFVFAKYRNLSAKKRQKHEVRGYSGKTVPVGVGDVDLLVQVSRGAVRLRLENVFFSPEHHNLLSQTEAHAQGFDVIYNNTARRNTLLKGGTTALQADMHPCGL